LKTDFGNFNEIEYLKAEVLTYKATLKLHTFLAQDRLFTVIFKTAIPKSLGRAHKSDRRFLYLGQDHPIKYLFGRPENTQDIELKNLPLSRFSTSTSSYKIMFIKNWENLMVIAFEVSNELSVVLYKLNFRFRENSVEPVLEYVNEISRDALLRNKLWEIFFYNSDMICLVFSSSLILYQYSTEKSFRVRLAKFRRLRLYNKRTFFFCRNTKKLYFWFGWTSGTVHHYSYMKLAGFFDLSEIDFSEPNANQKVMGFDSNQDDLNENLMINGIESGADEETKRTDSNEVNKSNFK
jgi:hypothetical protein